MTSRITSRKTRTRKSWILNNKNGPVSRRPHYHYYPHYKGGKEVLQVDMTIHVGIRDFGVSFQPLYRQDKYCLAISSGGNTMEVSMMADQAAAVANAIAAELNKHIEGAG